MTRLLHFRRPRDPAYREEVTAYTAKDNATKKQTMAMAFKTKLRDPQVVRAPHMGHLSVPGGSTLRLHLH